MILYREIMLKPVDGPQAIIDFVVDTVSKAGPNPCPPVIVGVGIGGTMEKAALMSKRRCCGLSIRGMRTTLMHKWNAKCCIESITSVSGRRG